jgi:DNA invertase Pin-like site-specific DNA recombinase
MLDMNTQNKNVKVIEPTRDPYRRNMIQGAKLKVAAYCRVSTDSEDQLNSYKSQKLYYTDLIQQNEAWEYVDVYADEGITGTNISRRSDFKRMIQDCLDSKIDMIITKAIPRFARNTVDTLRYVRMLQQKGVAVFFEVENINTLTMDGELVLTVLSASAQESSKATSSYVKKGIKMKAKRGETFGFSGCLGYNYDPQTKMVSIDEEEAKVVQYIFKRYVEGIGSYIIAKELVAQGVKTKRGNTTWWESSVRGIIKNERYRGDVLMGKSYTVDPISHRRLKNFGEETQYYISNAHEPIIAPEVFDKAQAIMNKRREDSVERGKRQKYSRKYAFSSKIQCGFCGAFLTRRKWHSTTNAKYVWQCITPIKNNTLICEHSKGLDENIIKDAFLQAYNYMLQNNQQVFQEFITNCIEALKSQSVKNSMEEIKMRITKVKSEMDKLVDLRLQDKIDYDIYSKKYETLKAELNTLQKEEQSCGTKLYDEKEMQKRIEKIRKYLKEQEPLKTFSRQIFDEMISYVVMGDTDTKDPYKLTFIFHNGWNKTVLPKKKQVFKHDIPQCRTAVYEYPISVITQITIDASIRNFGFNKEHGHKGELGNNQDSIQVELAISLPA